jgi:N-carbamoyl-L-amino-acid hydrolase
LRELTTDADGAQRVAWTDTWLQARRWFESKLQGLPLENHYDAAGNHWITLTGTSKKSLILGSHLDSVPNGGWLDGALGVLAGFAVMRRIIDESGGRPPVTVRLVDWADEEGARFGRSLFGSSAFAGTASIEADRSRTDRDGVRWEDALKKCGVNIDVIREATQERKEAAAYLELHIEQGPVLERLALPLGVVLGTKGVERYSVTFHGEEAHSGSTPMGARRDALAPAAKLGLEIRPIAGKHPDSVCTMGSVKTFPGIVTAVVGRCETTLDQRDLDAEVLAKLLLTLSFQNRLSVGLVRTAAIAGRR